MGPEHLKKNFRAMRRVSLLMALLTGFLAYLASVPRPNWVRVGLAAVSGMWFLYAIDFFRGVPFLAVLGRLTATCAPARASSKEITLPILRPPPVTSAT